MRQVLAEWAADDYVDAAILAVSELVTNAVLHARSGPMVTLRLEDRRLRVEVKDDSAVVPSRKRYGPQAGTGRGLMLVESLAVAWGCDSGPEGKSVWFELDPSSGEQMPVPDFGLSADDLADLAELASSPARIDGRRREGGDPPGQSIDGRHRRLDACVGGASRR